MPCQRQTFRPQFPAALPFWNQRRFLLFLFLSLLTFLAAGAASAQSFTPVMLNADTTFVPLGKHSLVRSDPQETLTEARLRQTQGGALSGRIAGTDILYLGQDGTAQWIAFKLLNTGPADNWILDIGRRLDGRIGHIASLNVYEMPLAMPGATQRPAFSFDEIKPKSDAGFYKIGMPASTQKLIILHVRPIAGMPSVLPLALHSEEHYLDHAQTRASFNAVYTMALIGFAVFFAIGGLIRKSAAGKSFAAYFLFAALCFILYEYLGEMRGFGLFKELTMVLSYAYSAIIVWMIRSYCRTDMGGPTERYILNALLILGAAAVFFSFFFSPGDGNLHTSILYGIPLATLAVVAMMTFAQSYTGRIDGYTFFGNWILAAISLLVMALAMRQILPVNALTLNAIWFSLLPQGIFLAGAMIRHRDIPGDQTIDHAETKKLNLSRLKQTKDEADHSRLLKVIEKERAMLAELRQREAIRMEEMRSAKEAADEANRAKSAFLAVVSHEIRTPMTGIMGMVRLLLDSNITKQQKDYVMTIQDSGDAMLALLNDILDFEKIQRGKMELENISFDLHRLIQGVVTLMSGHAEQKNITLNVQVGSDIPRFVKGDPTRLRQVLLNMMGNAIKFTEKGGVTLHVKNMDEGGAARGNIHTIYFAVQDSGIGIPAESQSKLFTPFAQADSTISRKFGGTGLGLAISKGLIAAMGSDININSKEGEGSTFFFTLKMEKGLPVTHEPAGATMSAPPAAQSDPKSILVVDDNDINRKVISNFLEQDKHIVTLSASAEEALAKMEERDFDIVFMDIELPGMSGNEATKIIRAHKNPVKSVTPVVAITGNVDSDDTNRYLADGMSGTLAKPIDADRLKAIVAGLAGKPHVQKVLKTEAAAPPPAPAIELPVDAPLSLQLEEPAESTPAPSRNDIAAQENVFNAEMVQSLKSAIGDDQLKQLLDELIVKTDEIIGAMVEAVQADDLDALYARAHELKGMTGNFGLLEISAIAARAEEQAKARQADGLDVLVQSLPNAATRARDALERWAA